MQIFVFFMLNSIFKNVLIFLRRWENCYDDEKIKPGRKCLYISFGININEYYTVISAYKRLFTFVKTIHALKFQQGTKNNDCNNWSRGVSYSQFYAVFRMYGRLKFYHRVGRKMKIYTGGERKMPKEKRKKKKTATKIVYDAFLRMTKDD